MIGRRLIECKSYVETFISPLKPIAKAVCNNRIVNSARIGLTRILHIPAFLKKKQAEQSRVVLYEAFLSNVVKYLLPVVMYKRAVNIFIDKSPDVLDPVLIAADWVVYVAVFGRLFLRRLVDNSINAINLYKAVSKDLSTYLSEVVSNELSRSLAPVLSNICSDTDVSDHVHQSLVEKLQRVLKRFFSNDMSSKSFPILEADLEKEFSLLFCELGEEKITYVMARQLAKLLAKAIADEFYAAIFHAEQLVNFSNEDEMTKLFSQKFVNKQAANFSKKLLTQIKESHLNKEVQLYLPDRSLKSCGCPFDRTIKGALSSALYYTGLTWLTFTPNLAEAVGLINVHPYVYYATFFLRALLYGQSLNETRFNAAGICARHRYHVGAANKIRFTFEGIAYLINIELLAFLVKQVAGVDNFLVRDAIASFLLLAHLMPSYTFHEPLKHPKKNPFDIFLPGREITRSTTAYLKIWLFPNLNDDNARREAIKQLGAALNSDAFSYVHFMLLGPSDFFPTNEWKQIQDERRILKKFLPVKLDSTQKIEAERNAIAIRCKKIQEEIAELEKQKPEGESKESKNEQKGDLNKHELRKSDQLANELMRLNQLTKDLRQLRSLRHARKPINVLLENSYINIFLELSANDLTEKLETAEYLRKVSSWLNTPLSILPIQGGIVTLLELPLQFLQNEVSRDVFRGIRAKLIEAKELQGAYRLPKQEVKIILNPAKMNQPSPLVSIQPEVKLATPSLELLVQKKSDIPPGLGLQPDTQSGPALSASALQHDAQLVPALSVGALQHDAQLVPALSVGAAPDHRSVAAPVLSSGPGPGAGIIENYYPQAVRGIELKQDKIKQDKSKQDEELDSSWEDIEFENVEWNMANESAGPSLKKPKKHKWFSTKGVVSLYHNSMWAAGEIAKVAMQPAAKPKCQEYELRRYR